MSSLQASVGRYRWLICLLLFLATTVNYIDRQILALLKPILGSAYLLAYGIGHLLAPRFEQVKTND